MSQKHKHIFIFVWHMDGAIERIFVWHTDGAIEQILSLIVAKPLSSEKFILLEKCFFHQTNMVHIANKYS